MKLAGWGNYPVVETDARPVSRRADVQRAVAGADSLIARGNGRAYGDAALHPRFVLDMRPLDRILSFDAAGGTIACESGVLLADLIPLVVRKGWFPPVVPGTKFVTIGGMAAADVHGKNHHVAGSFGNHVERLEIVDASGAVVACSPAENADLFAATLGGMGLTGAIVSVTFRLSRIETSWIAQETVVAENLDALMAAFEAARAATYAVAWIDCFARGPSRGRGILFRGEHLPRADLPAQLQAQPLSLPPRQRRRVPAFLPGGWLNARLVRTFNALLFARSRRGPRRALVHLDEFFFPLDAILDWNRIYGRRGFCQYQCVLPLAASRDGLSALLEEIARAESGSFLSVLKLLGPGRGLLSFPMEGYTLALDFPVSAAAFALMDRLDGITARHGGRVYLAKDARAGPEAVRRGYPDLAAFRHVRDAAGGGKFRSLLSQRLEL